MIFYLSFIFETKSCNEAVINGCKVVILHFFFFRSQKIKFVFKLGGCNFVLWIILQGGDLRYCQKCSLYKPPRAHHCRICNKCVLRMVFLAYISSMFYLDVLYIKLKVFHLDIRIIIACGWIIVWAMRTTRSSSSLLCMLLFLAYIPW